MVVINDTDLKQFVPNVLAEVQGETSLYEKCLPYINAAKYWVFRFIVPENVYDEVSEDMKAIVKRIVVIHAFHNAVPSLDLVLTPNGFGVVSNQNIAPASRDRVQALRDSLIISRDECINTLWQLLRGNDTFCKSGIGVSLQMTLFQDLSFSLEIGEKVISYDTWVQNRKKIIKFEDHIADHAVSHQLMNLLRHDMLFNTLSLSELYLINLIKAYTLEFIKNEPLHCCDFSDLVNHIKGEKALSDIWTLTDTSRIFDDHSFQNDRNKGGFWL